MEVMVKASIRIPRSVAAGSITVFVLAACSLLGGCTTLTGDSSAPVLRAKDKVAPALVHIRPVKEVFTRGQREEVLIVGSGFIISKDGYIVTNEHVAGESKQVKCVLSDREEVEASVIGADPYTDIAVLKLNVDHPLPYVRLGDSSKLEAGQTVIALGSPHGLARSVSKGIVSVTGRYLEDNEFTSAAYHTWIQTDAAINFGNSGGPLVNLKGEVIGVNARMLRGAENVGFAIPINTVKEVVDQIVKNGRVRRSWIGVTLQEMLAKTDDPAQEGVVIADVDPLSSAHEAGVQPGDVLVAINGASVNARFEEDIPAIRKRIADLPVGQAAGLTLRRGTEELAISVETEEKSALKGEEVEFPEWGFTAANLTPAIVRRAGLDAQKGVVVSGTQPGSAVSNAGLNAGDIILQMDGQEVSNLAQFQQAYRERIDAAQALVMLFVKRGALTRFVLVEKGAPAPMPSIEQNTTPEQEK